MRLAGKYLDYGPEDVAAIALGETVGDSMMPQEVDYGDVAGVIDMRDPRSQISGTSQGGGGSLSKDQINTMPEGPAKDALMRRYLRNRDSVALPGFLQGV